MVKKWNMHCMSNGRLCIPSNFQPIMPLWCIYAHTCCSRTCSGCGTKPTAAASSAKGTLTSSWNCQWCWISKDQFKSEMLQVIQLWLWEFSKQGLPDEGLLVPPSDGFFCLQPTTRVANDFPIDNRVFFWTLVIKGISPSPLFHLPPACMFCVLLSVRERVLELQKWSLPSL